MTRWAPATEADRAAMLAELGVEAVDDLFDAIPAQARLDRPLDIPAPLSEWARRRRNRGLSEMSRSLKLRWRASGALA